MVDPFFRYGPELWADFRDFEESLLSSASAETKAAQVQRAPWQPGGGGVQMDGLRRVVYPRFWGKWAKKTIWVWTITGYLTSSFAGFLSLRLGVVVWNQDTLQKLGDDGLQKSGTGGWLLRVFSHVTCRNLVYSTSYVPKKKATSNISTTSLHHGLR